MLGLALIRTAVCAFRAANQSITHDEAMSATRFINVPWHDLYFRYEANNHLLFSILAKLSISLFGDWELALRLPTVVAGFFLMTGFWAVLERLDSRPVRWAAFAVMGLHPLIFDFSVAARGYGLAMALMVWALWAAMNKRPGAAGILMGLSISANFTFAAPCMGLLAATFLLADGSWIRRLGRAAQMSLLAAATVLAICGGVLPLMSRLYFSAGFPFLRNSLFDLVYKSIRATPRAGLFGTPGAATILVFGFLTPILMFIAAACFLAWRKGDREMLIPALTLAVAGLGTMSAHYLAGVNYPIDRTGLWLMLLFGVAWAIAAGTVSYGLPLGINLVLATALAIQFASQFHVGFLELWWFDCSTKEIAHRLEQQVRDKPPGSISVGASWLLQPAFEYYRIHDRIEALEPVAQHDAPELTGHDYYLLTEQDRLSPEARDRTVLFSDSFAGVVLTK